jgi:hypothetical protein
VRRSKTDLPARVNGNLHLDFGDITLTSYAGLELFGRYLRQTGFNDVIRQCCASAPLGGDFGIVAMVRLFLALLVVGGRRVRHVAYLQDDVIVRRFVGLQVLPTARTVSRWLQRFTMRRVGLLQAINAAVIARVLPRGALRTVTVDVDGTVISTGLQVERAFRGFNPHRRKVPSYYPILAHLAETTHILRVQNRSGDVHDGKASLPFLRTLWTQLRTWVQHPHDVRFRLDGAFFREDVLRWLAARGAGYAIKVPFYQWLDLQAYIRQATHWRKVAPDVWGFALPLAVTPWATTLSVTIYRKRVHHRSAKNYQLDLFDPNDGHWEYSAVASNLGFSIRALWPFMCGRGLQEKTLGQLKTGLAFHTVPTQAYAANSAWQQLVALAHNLLVNFQIETGAPCRRLTAKRTVLPRLVSIQTLRFTLFHRAAQLVRPQGRAVLRLSDNAATRGLFTRIEAALARAA